MEDPKSYQNAQSDRSSEITLKIRNSSGLSDLEPKTIQITFKEMHNGNFIQLKKSYIHSSDH